MPTDDPQPVTRDAPIAALDLRRLQQRSNARGLWRLAGHLLAISTCCTLYSLALQRQAPGVLIAAACVAYGFTLVTMFAAMHEAVHRTAFKRQWLNDTVAWFAGLLSFYNSTFYRPYHGWHHRFTQIPGKDPELDDKKPTGWLSYFVELSGVTWWLGKLQTYYQLVLGRTGPYPFLNAQTGPGVVRSVRLQMLVYATAGLLSVAVGYPYFAFYWLIPVALGQPLLRAILLAEHTGCTQDDNALANTRTTYTSLPIRFLMWEMPYHAEHHRYPALPFFALAEAHQSLKPHLQYVAERGYAGVHLELYREFNRKPTPGPIA